MQYKWNAQTRFHIRGRQTLSIMSKGWNEAQHQPFCDRAVLRSFQYFKSHTILWIQPNRLATHTYVLSKIAYWGNHVKQANNALSASFQRRETFHGTIVHTLMISKTSEVNECLAAAVNSHFAGQAQTHSDTSCKHVANQVLYVLHTQRHAHDLIH